jgi:hypothetical protein
VTRGGEASFDDHGVGLVRMLRQRCSAGRRHRHAHWKLVRWRHRDHIDALRAAFDDETLGIDWHAVKLGARADESSAQRHVAGVLHRHDSALRHDEHATTCSTPMSRCRADRAARRAFQMQCASSSTDMLRQRRRRSIVGV